MKLVPDQIGGRWADEHIHRIRAREGLQARGQIDRISDDRGIEALVRLVGADVSDNRFPVIDAHAEAELRAPLALPSFIQLAQLGAHGQRRAHSTLRILLHALAFHVPPDSHDGVADKLVERSAVFEDVPNHPAEILVQEFYQSGRIGFLRKTGEADEIGEEHRHRFARAQHRMVVAVRIVQNFLDQVLGNVTFQRAPRAHLLQALEDILEAETK